MSAIVSVFNRDGRPVDPPIVATLLAASPERAVDGQDMWIDNQVALAHQHFWITPQEWGERQPLVNAAGSQAITADARLDNREELVELLNPPQPDLDQISDAALILLAYRHWGTVCVEKLLGDFAFVIWDDEEQQLFIARDTLGTRGLCYSINADHCLVASDVGQLLAHRGMDSQFNEAKIAEYLVGLYQDQEETFFKDVFYCPPAHCLLVTSDTVRKWRYWDIDPHARIRYEDDQEYADHFLELFKEAVCCRMRTVGPVGISMSGGLDSTFLAAVASELLPQTGLSQNHLKSFSYVFDELVSCDERSFIQPVADRYELDTTFIRCDDKWTLRDIHNWPVLKGYLFHDAYAWLPDAVMSEAGKAGCRVLLAGYYGDALFLGARSWAAGMMADLRFGELAGMIAGHSKEIDWRRDLLMNGMRHMLPHRLRMLYGRTRTYDIVAKYPGLHPELVDHVQLSIRRDADQPRRRFFGADHWHRYLNLTVNVFSQGFTAVCSQYNNCGVELLVPYWDRRLVEFVMSIPAEQLGRPWYDRWLMRNAAAGLLPSAVVERRWKTSFEPLMKKGLVEKESATVAALMENPQVVDRKYVRKEWLKQALEDGEGWRTDQSRLFLWKCLSLELWLKVATRELSYGRNL